MLFPTATSAKRCLKFLLARCKCELSGKSRIINFVGVPGEAKVQLGPLLDFSAVLFPSSCFPTAKTFWQHTGEGVSSRRAEYCRLMYEDGFIAEESAAQVRARQKRGPKRYSKKGADQPTTPPADAGSKVVTAKPGIEGVDQTRFVEERFGRNLRLDQANDAKEAIKRRIAGSLTSDTDLTEALQQDENHEKMRNVPGFKSDDVYLYPCGMNAIYSTHLRLLNLNRDQPLKAICFGFPYIDTLKVLEKFGPGCLFYGNGTQQDLDDLERRLQAGERYASLFCEFPSNPLLRTPDLQRIRDLADQYDFAIVVDETIGNFLNVSILPLADVMVSSLTKIFSGDSNVMGGWYVLDPAEVYAC